MLKHKLITLTCIICSLFVLAQAAFAQDANTDVKSAQDQALKLYQTFKNKDWRGLADLIQLSAVNPMEDRDAFAKAFETGLKQGDPDDYLGKIVDNMSDIRVGAAVVEGKYAYVSASSVVVIQGKTLQFLGLIKLIKVGDIWRWDLTFVDDPEKASAQRFQELLGVPQAQKS